MNALALVVGIDNYHLEKNKLDNAVNDSIAIRDKLLQLGYVVINETNCSTKEFATAISEFSTRLEKFDIGLFFFSGHGLQIDGENYLCATDTDFAGEGVAKYTSIPLNQLLSDMNKANPKVKIVILDACRNNPYPDTFRGTFNKGLAPIYAPKGTIIAFSTSPGETALDGGGGSNSIYTSAILKHIEDKNIQIEEFFKRVRTSVFTLSGEKQLSWEHTSLIGDYFFNSGQLVHSVDLPYDKDVVADSNYITKDSVGDQIVDGLKTLDWYKQNPAFQKFENLKVESVDSNLQFLLGRNILQTVDGGEFAAIEYFQRLGNKLSKWNIDGTNHVLNGILYEIYFDSNGRLRQGLNFKSNYIDEIFVLEDDGRYKSSFDFITKQLKPFKDYIFYIPSSVPVNLPIEIVLEQFPKTKSGKESKSFNLTSLKHQNNEFLELNEDDYVSYSLSDFYQKVSSSLCVPKKRLTITINVSEKKIKWIYAPWKFQYSPK